MSIVVNWSGQCGKSGESLVLWCSPSSSMHFYAYLQVDLDSKLGRTQVITKTTPAAGQGGFVLTITF